ncbi:MAG: hypothetical protein WDA21_04180, partial [Bacilli bacterium]
MWDVIVKTLRNFFFFLDTILYGFIEEVYNFILRLSTFNLFDYETDIAPIAQRVYLFLGIIMLFRIAFLLITIIVNPVDSFDKKQKEQYQGRVIPSVIITLLLVIALPFIFNLTIEVQNKVLDVQPDPENPGELMMGDNNLIRKVILPTMPEYKDKRGVPKWTCIYNLRAFKVYDSSVSASITSREDALRNILLGDSYLKFISSNYYTLDQDTHKVTLYGDEYDVLKEYVNNHVDEIGNYDSTILNDFPELDDSYLSDDWVGNSGRTNPQIIKYAAYNIGDDILTSFGNTIGTVTGEYGKTTNGYTSVDGDMTFFLTYGVENATEPTKYACMPYLNGYSVFQGSVTLRSYSSYQNLSDRMYEVYNEDELQEGIFYWSLIDAEAEQEFYPMEGGKLIVSYLMKTFMKSNNTQYQDRINIGDYNGLKILQAMDETNISSDKYIEYTPFISTILILGVLIVIASVTLDIALR